MWALFYLVHLTDSRVCVYEIAVGYLSYNRSLGLFSISNYLVFSYVIT